MITVKKYTKEDYTLWNNFVATAKNATFLFHRDFMEYHNDRFEDYSLLCFKKNKLIAILPANVVGDTVYSHRGLTYGGLVLQETSKLLTSFEVFKSLLKFLTINEIKTLYLKVIPTFYNSMPSDELEYFLFKANAKLVKKDILMVIDYQNQLKFQKNRREGINKAVRSGLQVKVDTNFDDFWNDILIPNLKNKHQVSPVHCLEEIKHLAQKFPDNIKQVNVYQNDKLVAGSTIFLTKTTIHPQYVSGDLNKNKLGSLDLLYDFIINKLELKKRYFDFNISSENDGNVLNSGLVFWKETCGARSYMANNYEINTAVCETLTLNIK